MARRHLTPSLSPTVAERVTDFATGRRSRRRSYGAENRRCKNVNTRAKSLRGRGGLQWLVGKLEEIGSRFGEGGAHIHRCEPMGHCFLESGSERIEFLPKPVERDQQASGEFVRLLLQRVFLTMSAVRPPGKIVEGAEFQFKV